MVKPTPRTMEAVLRDIREQLDLLANRRTPGSSGGPDMWRQAGRAGAATGGTVGTGLSAVPGTSVTISVPAPTRLRAFFMARLVGAGAVSTMTFFLNVDGVQVQSFDHPVLVSGQTASLVFEAPISEGVHTISVSAATYSGSVGIVSRGAGQPETTSLSVDYLTT